MFKLAVTWVDHIKKAFKRKRVTYKQLVEKWRGSRICCAPTEVGCSGFKGCSACTAFTMTEEHYRGY